MLQNLEVASPMSVAASEAALPILEGRAPIRRTTVAPFDAAVPTALPSLLVTLIVQIQ